MPSVSRAPEFFSPLPLAAVGVLALNDHVLKAAFHNAVTGKVSDFAGCFFLPLFVSAVLAEATRWSLAVRLGLGAAATFAIFVPVKVSATAAGLVASALDLVSVPLGIGAQHITVDPTDLLALPMVALAVHLARKADRCAASSK